MRRSLLCSAAGVLALAIGGCGSKGPQPAHSAASVAACLKRNGMSASFKTPPSFRRRSNATLQRLTSSLWVRSPDGIAVVQFFRDPYAAKVASLHFRVAGSRTSPLLAARIARFENVLVVDDFGIGSHDSDYDRLVRCIRRSR
jgi:hypothetical protein